MRLAKLEAKQPDVTMLLQEIADTVVIEWARVRGKTTTSACTSLQANVLSLVIGNALTETEQRLARDMGKRMQVQRQISQVLDGLYPRLATLIEAKLRCYVGGSDVSVEPLTGNVRFTIELREAQPLYTALQPLTACV